MSKVRRKILRLFLLFALVGACALAFAQAPPGEARFEPCDPATEPCEAEAPVPEAGETPVAEASSEPAEPGPEAVVEEDPAIEASADEEFTPGDEISEDYPIPLPSDI